MECDKQSKWLPFDPYNAKIFHNLYICSTGIQSKTETNRIAQAIQKEGGKFQLNLIKDQTTHLLVATAATTTTTTSATSSTPTSSKYIHAKS